MVVVVLKRGHEEPSNVLFEANQSFIWLIRLSLQVVRILGEKIWRISQSCEAYDTTTQMVRVS